MDVIEVAMPTRRTSDADSNEGVGFDLVFVAEQRALISLALSLTGSRAVAEDLTQEAFLRLHQRWSRVATYDRPDLWLRRVLLNLATSRARRLGAEARALVRLGRERRPDFVLSPETTEFWSALRALPRRQAQVVALYYAEDRPVAEIAEVLCLAEGTVRALLHQGRQTLRARLGLDDDEEGRR